MRTYHYDVAIHGALCGHMWMPQVKASSGWRVYDLERESARLWCADGSRDTLRDLVQHIITENGGDFQDARFTADSMLMVSKVRQRGSHRCSIGHCWPLMGFPSIADYVDETAYSSDFDGCDAE